jgi:hypothetical protein
MTSHDASDLAEIAVEYHVEFEGHGHGHGEVSDLIQIYHGHPHDATDHDHNTAFLAPRSASDIPITDRTNWALDGDAMSDRRSAELDRPPRV